MVTLSLKESSMETNDAVPGDISAVGRNIRRYREALGLSLRQLDRLSGVSNTTIGNYERGSVKYPRRREVEAIAKALGRNVEEMYHEPGEGGDDGLIPEFRYPVFLSQMLALLEDIDPERVRKVAEMFTQLDKEYVDWVLDATEFWYSRQLRDRHEEEGGKPGPKPYRVRDRSPEKSGSVED